MIGFELNLSNMCWTGVGSHRSSNRATTTAQNVCLAQMKIRTSQASLYVRTNLLQRRYCSNHFQPNDQQPTFIFSRENGSGDGAYSVLQMAKDQFETDFVISYLNRIQCT